MFELQQVDLVIALVAKSDAAHQSAVRDALTRAGIDASLLREIIEQYAVTAADEVYGDDDDDDDDVDEDAKETPSARAAMEQRIKSVAEALV